MHEKHVAYSVTLQRCVQGLSEVQGEYRFFFLFFTVGAWGSCDLETVVIFLELGMIMKVDNLLNAVEVTVR